MSKQVNKTAVGIFMVSAIALLVAAVLVLGSGKFFQNRPKYIMFFEGSVQGLSVGSPVVFRGVKVGEVTDIKLAFNVKDLSIRIPVFIELGEGKVEMIGGDMSIAHAHKEFAGGLIKKGIRAQLAMQSIVTGQLMVSLDFHPEKKAVFVGMDKRYTEIPTIPTPLQDLAKKFEKVPIEDILNKVQDAMTGVTKIINSPEVATILKSVSQGVGEARSLVRNMDRQVGPAGERLMETAEQIRKLATRMDNAIEPLAASITKASDEATAALKQSNTVLANAEGVMNGESIMGYRIVKALEAFEEAARSMQVLADTIERRPEAVIFGKKISKEAAK